MWIIYVKKPMECFGNDNMMFSVYNNKPCKQDIEKFIEKANEDRIFGVDCKLSDLVAKPIGNGSQFNFWLTKSTAPTKEED